MVAPDVFFRITRWWKSWRPLCFIYTCFLTGSLWRASLKSQASIQTSTTFRGPILIEGRHARKLVHRPVALDTWQVVVVNANLAPLGS